MRKLPGIAAAEFVGTFALTFVGILAIHNVSTSSAEINLLLVALAHGLTLAIFVTATMPTSGGHLNPAVTAGFLATGKIKPGEAMLYWISQLLGSVFAALVAYGLYHGNPQGAGIITAGTPMPGAQVSSLAALSAEIVASFFLIFVVWGTAADPQASKVGGFAIGLTIAVDIMAVGPISGASMNPARSFGPTLVASMFEGNNLWGTHWIYWVGPIVGGVLAAWVYRALLWPSEK